MVAFYTKAFGARFREVDTFGLVSQFSEIVPTLELAQKWREILNEWREAVGLALVK